LAWLGLKTVVLRKDYTPLIWVVVKFCIFLSYRVDRSLAPFQKLYKLKQGGNILA
jgi:hypothetical protein